MNQSWPQSQSPSRIAPGPGDDGVSVGLGTPPLFHWAVLPVVLGLLLFAAVRHIVFLLAICIFMILVGGIAWYWSRRSLQRLTFSLAADASRAFPGEAVGLSLRIANNKRLPLPWLEVELELPYELVNGRGKGASVHARERVSWATSVSPGQRLTWKHIIECKARGEYALGSVRLRSGDMFGIFPVESIRHGQEPFLVYPRVVPVSGLSLPVRQLTGDRPVPRTIYEDLSRTVGTRDYQREDPLKRIHWSATARQQRLQSRQYDSTTSLSTVVVLDAASYCPASSENEDAFELAVTTAASLAYDANERGAQFGLMAGSEPQVRIPRSSGRSQLLLVLESLARIKAQSSRTLQELVAATQGEFLPGTTVLLVTNELSAEGMGVAGRLHQQGQPVAVVVTGSGDLPEPAGSIPVIGIRSLHDLSGAQSKQP